MSGRATLAGLVIIMVIALLVVVPGVQLARYLSDEAPKPIFIGSRI